MSVARVIADQRTNYRVPHTLTCLLLGVSLAWFYKWWNRATEPSATSGLHTTRDRCRDTIDCAVRVAFGKARGLHGSPRLHADLRNAGWTACTAFSVCSSSLEGVATTPEMTVYNDDHPRSQGWCQLVITDLQPPLTILALRSD